MIWGVALALCGCGAVARYWASEWVGGLFRERVFPFGVFVVNCFGSLLVGAFFAADLSDDLSYLLSVAFLGSFTTVSGLFYDSSRLLREGSKGTSLANLALSFGVAFGCCGCGYLVVGLLTN